MSLAINDAIKPLAAHLKTRYPRQRAESAFVRWYAEMCYGRSGYANTTHYCVDGSGDLGVDYCIETTAGYIVIQSKWSLKSLTSTLPKTWYTDFDTVVSHLSCKSSDDEFEAWLAPTKSLKVKLLYPKVRRAAKDGKPVRFILVTTRPANGKSLATFRVDAQEEIAYLWRLFEEGFHTPFDELELTLRQSFFRPHADGRVLTGVGQVNEFLKAMQSAHAQGGSPERLFDQNVRSWLGSKTANKAIVESYKADPDQFFAKHNGLYVVTPALTKLHNRPRYRLKFPSVVNGAQTLWSLYDALKAGAPKRAEVLVRVLETKSARVRDAVIAATNTQNAMTPAALLSHHESLAEIARRLFAGRVFLERQQNSWTTTYKGTLAGYRRVKLTELIQWTRAAHDVKILGSLRSRVAPFMLDKSADDALYPLVKSKSGSDATRLIVAVAVGLLVRRIPSEMGHTVNGHASGPLAKRLKKDTKIASLLLVHTFSQAVGFSARSRQLMLHALDRGLENQIPDDLLQLVRRLVTSVRRGQTAGVDFSNLFKKDQDVELVAKPLTTPKQKKEVRDALIAWAKQ